MYRRKRIAVAVPAYNEEGFVADVVSTIPSYVDAIYVVDDASTDNTATVLGQLTDSRLTVLTHDRNRGVGAAFATAFRAALDEGADIVATMAGDGQMDPQILHLFLDPIIDGSADCTKGDRFSNPIHKQGMPRHRVIGTHVLNQLTRIASGYGHIADAQGGYTACNAYVLRQLGMLQLSRSGYAFENLFLIQLRTVRARVLNIPHPARYGNEQSTLRLLPFIVRTSLVLLQGLAGRLVTEARAGVQQVTTPVLNDPLCPGHYPPVAHAAAIRTTLPERTETE
ncbi:MAG: glycosyltransferase family 2 protein [Chloroflexota bacterium]